MKKKELLAPAGDFECLKYAIHAGADAVYIGGKKFGARAYAKNFSDEELIEALKYAHLYGVLVYVTINTLIHESEIEMVLEYVKFLYLNGVDAVIMTDIGLIKRVHEHFPLLEIHASTQLNTHNIAQVKFLKELGVKRVILARELSLSEIESVQGILDTEVFIHGALCISYSGQCLFSSRVMDRSGNRGECAGLCRLPYQLYLNEERMELEGDYPLSTRELNTAPQFLEIMKSSIYSFKIEGRMKSPAYVGYITSIYRKLIDQFENGEEVHLSSDDLKNMETLYSRGFTQGHMFQQKGLSLMNIKTSNHQGIYLGDIVDIDPKYIKIKLIEDLKQEDGIRFIEEEKGMFVNFLYDRNKKLINKAFKGDLVFVDNKINLKEKGSVYKTVSKELEDSLKELPMKKILIEMDVKVNLIDGFMLEVSDGINQVLVNKKIVSRSIQMPITEENVKKQLKKLGNTPFILNNISLLVEDDVFVNIREINEIRREAVEKLIYLREHNFRATPLNEHVSANELKANKQDLELSVGIIREEQLHALKEFNIKEIFVQDEDIYNKYKEQYPNLYLRINRISKQVRKFDQPLMIGNQGTLFENLSLVLYGDHSLNVTNHLSIDYYLNLGLKKVMLSSELKLQEIDEITSYYKEVPAIMIYLYGRLPIMVMNHCLIRDIKKCDSCGNNKLYLEDRYKKQYPLVMDKKEHITYMYDNRILNLMENMEEYLKMGISNFFIDFFDESEDEVKSVLTDFLLKSVKMNV